MIFFSTFILKGNLASFASQTKLKAKFPQSPLLFPSSFGNSHLIQMTNQELASAGDSWCDWKGLVPFLSQFLHLSVGNNSLPGGVSEK